MADFNTLIADIRAAIYENTEQAITGDALQDILLEMVTDINAAKADQGDLDALAGVVAGKADNFSVAGPLALVNGVLQLYYSGHGIQLEADGYIYSSVGRGSFLTDKLGEDSAQRKQAAEAFFKAAQEAVKCGVTKGELQMLLNDAIK